MKENNKEDSYCHYSDLPSPMAYVQKKEEKNIMKRLIQKLLLWWSFKKPKKNKKSIWKL
jgi:hypothetical protein